MIDRHRSEPLSLRDVASELGMTPGHLTTVVRRRTGRTVQEWIIERRMTEARNLLSDTELTRRQRSRGGSACPIRDTSAGCSAARMVHRHANGAVVLSFSAVPRSGVGGEERLVG